MTKFLQKKNVFLIEYKYIWFFRQKNIEYKKVFLQHFSNHKQGSECACEVLLLYFQMFSRYSNCESKFIDAIEI